MLDMIDILVSINNYAFPLSPKNLSGTDFGDTCTLKLINLITVDKMTI